MSEDTKPIAATGVPLMCSCCGRKKMAVEYSDRIVLKVSGHVLIITKPLTGQVP